MLVGLAAAIAAQAQGSPPSYLHFDGGTAVLDAPWQFHLGDDPRWSAPTFDDSAWEKLSPDAPWGEQGHANIDGFAWYRTHLRLQPGEHVPHALSLLIPWCEDACEIYWNGKPAGSYGKLPPHPVWYLGPRPSRFDLGPASDGLLAVRVWKAPYGSDDTGRQGGFYGASSVGNPEAVTAVHAQGEFDWLRSQQLVFALNSLYAIVGLLCLLAWLRDRGQRLVFWMAILCLSRTISSLIISTRNPLPVTLALSSQTFFYRLSDVALWMVLLWLLDLNTDSKVARAVKILAIADFLAGLIDACSCFGFASPNPVPWQIADGLLTAFYTIAELVPVFLIGIAVFRRKRLDLTRWIVAGLTFATQLLLVGRYALAQGSRFTHCTLAEKISAPLFTVFGSPVDGQTIGGTLLLLALVFAVYRYSAEARRERARLETEIRNARVVQQVLIPDAMPTVPGFLIESVYKAASEVGGDLFQILPLDEGGLLAVIGDVSGKGMPAAMTVSLLVGTVRALSHYTRSPADILAAMNRLMLGRSNGGFTTCLVLHASADGRLTAASAGHLSPYISGREVEVAGGLPLGLSATESYPETTFHLEPGEQLTLVTDGVVEAQSVSGELFGFERTGAISHQPAEKIAQAAQDFGQQDDITVVTLTLEPAAVIQA
jgi:hypothetical protein